VRSIFLGPSPIVSGSAEQLPDGDRLDVYTFRRLGVRTSGVIPNHDYYGRFFQTGSGQPARQALTKAYLPLFPRAILRIMAFQRAALEGVTVDGVSDKRAPFGLGRL
jgi:hypothetical protein